MWLIPDELANSVRIIVAGLRQGNTKRAIFGVEIGLISLVILRVLAEFPPMRRGAHLTPVFPGINEG